jgi:outer membrane protein TolC
MHDQGRIDETGALFGLIFEYPLGNNTAEARLRRRELEMRQQFSQMSTTLDTILLEVRISVREVNTGWRDLEARSAAARAAREEVAHMIARKDIEAMRAPASSYLRDLVDAQDRQAETERALTQALAVYQVSLLNLQRAQGTLLEFSSIHTVRSEKDGLPLLELEKTPPPPPALPGETPEK